MVRSRNINVLSFFDRGPYFRTFTSEVLRHLRLLLGCSSLGLCSSLAIASDHDNAEEGAHNGGPEEHEDDGNANGPNAWRENAVERVVCVDERLESIC